MRMTFVGHNTQLRWRLRSNRYDHLDRRVQKVTSAATSNSSTPNSSTWQLYVPFYDANGNVMGWLSGIPDS